MRKRRVALAVCGLVLGISRCGAAEPERWFGFNTYAPNAETLRHFADAGVNTVACFPANNLGATGVPYNNAYPPIWNGPGTYDFDCLDKQVADKLAVNPKAKFIFFIDLNTPPWWCRIRSSSDSFSQLGRVAASDVWRRDTREYLQAVLQHLESHHRDVIIAYFLACGMTIEWQDFNRGEEGVIRREAWRRWMLHRGQADPVDIPPASVRDHVSHGPFRDPIDDALAINYWRFSHALIGETILYFAAATQEIVKHRAPLGLCYGYCVGERFATAGARGRRPHLLRDRGTFVRQPPADRPAHDRGRPAYDRVAQDLPSRHRTVQRPRGGRECVPLRGSAFAPLYSAVRSRRMIRTLTILSTSL